MAKEVAIFYSISYFSSSYYLLICSSYSNVAIYNENFLDIYVHSAVLIQMLFLAYIVYRLLRLDSKTTSHVAKQLMSHHFTY